MTLDQYCEKIKKDLNSVASKSNIRVFEELLNVASKAQKIQYIEKKRIEHLEKKLIEYNEIQNGAIKKLSMYLDYCDANSEKAIAENKELRKLFDLDLLKDKAEENSLNIMKEMFDDENTRKQFKHMYNNKKVIIDSAIVSVRGIDIEISLCKVYIELLDLMIENGNNYKSLIEIAKSLTKTAIGLWSIPAAIAVEIVNQLEILGTVSKSKFIESDKEMKKYEEKDNLIKLWIDLMETIQKLDFRPSREVEVQMNIVKNIIWENEIS